MKHQGVEIEIDENKGFGWGVCPNCGGGFRVRFWTVGHEGEENHATDIGCGCDWFPAE
jgi:hypothetical protein